MRADWLDYSFARPDLHQARASGCVGVFRYLAPDEPATHGKILFAEERDEILAAGLDLVLNWESYSTRATEGRGAGYSDGGRAREEAAALDYPEGAAIYFSVDTDTSDFAAVDDYFAGVRQGLAGRYKIGGYGSYTIVRHLLANHRADVGWQTLAWSAGMRDPGAVIYQDGASWFHGSADEDIVTGSVWSWREAEKQAPSRPAPAKPPARPAAAHHGAHEVKPPAGHRVVVVHHGDTLSSIAQRFGTTWQHLAELNHLHNPDSIHVGEVLTIDAPEAPHAPVTAGPTVIVRNGDTLTKIADRIHTTWPVLARLNRIPAPYVIREGQKLRIP